MFHSIKRNNKWMEKHNVSFFNGIKILHDCKVPKRFIPFLLLKCNKVCEMIKPKCLVAHSCFF